MSNGGGIPYHLRHNKAVDRNLFVDMLARINNYVNISEYTYVSFGGPFLEDFRQIHNALKIKKMYSLEMDGNVHKRQQFNMPLSCISIGEKPEKCDEFINRYDFSEKTIIWLDYTEPRKLNVQLNELTALISKLKPNDIFKITVNAHSETLGRDPGLVYRGDHLPFRLEKFKEIITERFSPYQLNIDHIKSKIYPTTLLHSINKAIHIALAERNDIQLQPLSAFIYSDGMTMLTATGIILSKDANACSEFFKDSRLENWKFLDKTWEKPRNISIPVMSLKERMFIESLLPDATHSEIIEKMGFYIAHTEPETCKQLSNFMEYYRVIPWFSKIVI